jgi:hypothetical protein
MKTLSVRNPYALLLCAGIKDVENRGYSTKHRGPLLIHATGVGCSWLNSSDMPRGLKRRIRQAADDDIDKSLWDKDVAAFDMIIRRCVSHYHLPDDMDEVKDPKQALVDALKKYGPPFPEGSIIGQVDLIDIVTDSKSEWALPYKKHWIIENPILFDTPIKNVKGRLNLWDFDIENHR